MVNESRRRRGGGNAGDQAGEHRSGPIAGTAVIGGVTFQRKALQFAEVDGLAMFEGDIVLGPASHFSADAGSQPMASVGITGQQFRWPNGRVPYEIDGGMTNQQRITDAIAHWEANTPIRFVLRTAGNAATFPDFVHFQDGGGCSSMVGKRGGRQDITLGGGCGSGNAIHEIGHTVGLWHEQSREDRDTFVRIQWANVDPAMSHNFDQHIADGDDLGAYDYGSIMHYPPTAFSVNGQPTIVALQPIPAGVTVGQRTGLSAGDIAGVQAMYPGLTVKEVPKDGVLDPTVKEIGKDPILDPTVKEVPKDPTHDPTTKEVHKDPIQDPTFKEVGKDGVLDPIDVQGGRQGSDPRPGDAQGGRPRPDRAGHVRRGQPAPDPAAELRGRGRHGRHEPVRHRRGEQVRRPVRTGIRRGGRPGASTRRPPRAGRAAVPAARRCLRGGCRGPWQHWRGPRLG